MTPPPTAVPGLRSLLVLALLLGVVLLPPALRAEFLNFDDNRLFGPDSELAQAGLGGALDPRRTIADVYLPVTHGLMTVERWLGGDGPLFPHLVSFGLHLGMAFALARLLARLGLSVVAATAAAALFAVHPALVESVAWAAGQKDLLSGLFVVATLAVLLGHARGTLATGPALWLGAGCALLAMYSKATAVVLAPGALWLAFSYGRADTRGRWRPAAGVAVAVGLAALHHMGVAAGVGTLAAGGEATARLAQVPGAYLHYVQTAVLPTGLDVMYPEVKTLEAFRAALGPGIALLLGGVVLALATRRRSPGVAAGIGAFALALLPFNTAFPASSIAAADRYLYLALPALAVACVSVPRVGVALTCVLVAPAAYLARDRAHDFERSEVLWTASKLRDDENAVALFNLASARYAQEDRSPDSMLEIVALLERAVEVARYPQHRLRAAKSLAEIADFEVELERAFHFAELAAAAADELDPRQPGALRERLSTHLLAARFARRNEDLDAANRHFEVANTLAPEDPTVLAFGAAKLHAEAMRPDGSVDPRAPQAAAAEALLDRAEAADPESYDVHWTRGLWCRATGRLLESEVALRRAVRIDPRRPEAWIARCDLFLAQPGLAATAENMARQGIAAVGDRASAALQFRLALALGAQGRLDDARQFYESALKLRPHDQRLRTALAAVLSALGVRDLYASPPEVLGRLADRILELDPTNPKGLLIRAVAFRGSKNIPDALVLLERVRADLPNDREVRQLYAECLRDRGWQSWLDESTREISWQYFVRYLAEAPSGMDTQAVHELVLKEWRRQFEAGQAALIDRDIETAERALRSCLTLRPDVAAPNLQLGMALLMRDRESATLEAALQCFDLAAEEQRRAARDSSLPELYALTALLRLGRLDEARTRGAAYLADAGAAADPGVLERIRALLEG